MVFALRVSKNVLTSMRVSTQDNMMTSRVLESGNTLFLNEANMDSTLSPDRLDQANFIHEQTDALDNYLQEIMVDILLATHEDNRLAIAEDGSIDLGLVKDLDVHKSTELIIFGSQLEIGEGPDLLNSLKTHRQLLLDLAGPELDVVINELLDTGEQAPYGLPWLQQSFAQSPMIAAMISLSNLQFKIQFLEGELLKELL